MQLKQEIQRAEYLAREMEIAKLAGETAKMRLESERDPDWIALAQLLLRQAMTALEHLQALAAKQMLRLEQARDEHGQAERN